MSIDHRSAPALHATPVLFGRVGRSPAPTPLADAGDRPLFFAIERIKGRRVGLRDPSEPKQPKVSRSSITAGTMFEPTDSGRFWLAAGLNGESRRRAVPIAGGRKLVGATASIGAGWIEDNHWQLSTRYLLHRDDSKWTGLQRGIELASGGQAAARGVVAAIAYSPAFDQAGSTRIGIEARRDRISADDAHAQATTTRDRSVIALTLATGF